MNIVAHFSGCKSETELDLDEYKDITGIDVRNDIMAIKDNNSYIRLYYIEY